MEAARGEQAVGRGLRLQVGELLRAEAADQHLAVAREQVGERAAAVLAVREDAADGVAQQPRLGGHPPREVGGVGDGGRLRRQERPEQRAGGRRAAGFAREPVAVEAAESRRRAPSAYQRNSSWSVRIRLGSASR